MSTEEDDAKVFTWFVPWEKDNRFFVERGARGRPNLKKMEERDLLVSTLLYSVFDRDVQEAYAGVYWGLDQTCCAQSVDGQMYFNARLERTLFELYTDICHEYTHVVREDSSSDGHGAVFVATCEDYIASRIPRLLKFCATIKT